MVDHIPRRRYGIDRPPPDQPRIETVYVLTRQGARVLERLTGDYHAVAKRCFAPISVAEIAAVLQRPLDTVLVVAGALAARGFLEAASPAAPSGYDLGVIKRLIQAVEDLQVADC